MNLIPLYDETVPIACSAGPAEIADRLTAIERLHAYLERVERTPHGLLLSFPNRPWIEADLRQFAVDEKGCCRFWGFAIDMTSASVALRWDGPPEASELLDQLLDYFEGDDPKAAHRLFEP